MDLPRGIGASATRALTAAGYVRLDQLDGVPAQELGALHGVGAKALHLLREALDARDMRLADRGPDPRDHRPMSTEPARHDEGGDPACWMHLVCPGCGLLTEEEPPLAVCPRCGEER